MLRLSTGNSQDGGLHLLHVSPLRLVFCSRCELAHTREPGHSVYCKHGADGLPTMAKGRRVMTNTSDSLNREASAEFEEVVLVNAPHPFLIREPQPQIRIREVAINDLVARADEYVTVANGVATVAPAIRKVMSAAEVQWVEHMVAIHNATMAGPQVRLQRRGDDGGGDRKRRFETSCWFKRFPRLPGFFNFFRHVVHVAKARRPTKSVHPKCNNNVLLVGLSSSFGSLLLQATGTVWRW